MFAWAADPALSEYVGQRSVAGRSCTLWRFRLGSASLNQSLCADAGLHSGLFIPVGSDLHADACFARVQVCVSRDRTDGVAPAYEPMSTCMHACTQVTYVAAPQEHPACNRPGRPFCDKPIEDCSTRHRCPRQRFVTEGPRQRYVTEGGGGDRDKPLFRVTAMYVCVYSICIRAYSYACTCVLSGPCL